jgi:hypothetical protein
MALELKDDDEITTKTDEELVSGGDPGTTYGIRHLTLEKIRDIQKANTTKVPNRRTHQRDDVINWEGVNDAMLDHALASWTGIVSKGKPLDCVLANKKKLDAIRRAAILEVAGMNEVQTAPESREESFRAPA